MLLGIVEAIWGGASIPLKPGSMITLGGITSKPQVVGVGVDFSNSMEPSEISLKVAIRKGTVITDMFPAGVQQELQVQCDSGQIFTWESAFRSGPIKIITGDASEADVTLAAGTPLEQVR